MAVLSVVPKPPVIRVHRVTASSIALRWTSGDTGNSPIIAYRIKFKITYGEWEEKQVDTARIREAGTVDL